MNIQVRVGGRVSPQSFRRRWAVPLALLLLGCSAEPLPPSSTDRSTSRPPDDPFVTATDAEIERASEGLTLSVSAACRTESDCVWVGGAACVSNRCVPCSAHAQCASQTCDTYAATLFGRGRCLPEAKVLYVDAGKCGGIATCGLTGVGSGTKADPFCSIRDAVAAAGTGGKDVVRVLPGLYCPFHVTGKSVKLFGPAGEGGEADVTEEDTGGPSVAGGGDVVVDGFLLGRHSTVGLRCTASGAAPVLRARRNKIVSDVGVGLSVDGCLVEADRNHVSGMNGAIALTDARYRLTNNVVTGASERAAVRIERGSGEFAYNTIVGNGDLSLGIAGAIDCGSTPVTIEDSIIFDNAMDATGSQLTGACSLARVVVGETDGIVSSGAIRLDPSLDGFRLTASPANDGCCVNRGRPSWFVRTDVDGTRRPQAGGWDIGAHERR
jgi:hypothetical protein